MAQWLVLYYVIDLFCLKTLPLLSRLSVIGFSLTEFNFTLEGQIDNLRPVGHFRFQSRRPFSTLLFFIKFLITLGCLTFDLLYFGILDRSSADIILHLCLLGLTALNTVFLYQYKVRTIVQKDIDRDGEVLRVKWVAHMIMAFLAPFFVFMLN